MQLNELKIERNMYTFRHEGTEPGAIGGVIKFADKHRSEITLVLTPDHIDAILAIVADAMVEQTRKLATDLTANIIEHARTSAPMLGVDA